MGRVQTSSTEGLTLEVVAATNFLLMPRTFDATANPNSQP